MRSLSGCSAILLTLFFLASSGRSSADGVTATCSAPQGEVQDLGWLEDLSATLNESVGGGNAAVPPAIPPAAKKNARAKPSPKPSPSPEAVAKEIEEDDGEGGRAPGRYDLEPSKLARLAKASHVAANRCLKRICRQPRRSKYMCYHGVKDALAGAGLVDGMWSEEAAVDAHRHGSLAKRGFKNVIAEGFDSRNAPLGAVLVYAGGKYRCRDERRRRMQCGHIEVKLGRTEYCSDFCSTRPVDSHLARKLVGVYVKE